MTVFTALLENLASPTILFFAVGVVAALAGSDLKFPEPLSATLTIYLLTAVGLKGGVAIHEAGLGTVLVPALAAIALGAAIPLWLYPILRYAGKLKQVDAASVAAHYGSVSAVTFITALDYLKTMQTPYESHATALLAVMESPAIVMGVLLGKMSFDGGRPRLSGNFREVAKEALLGRSVLLLGGGLIVGALCGKTGLAKVEGFFVTPFQGVLALFLMEMGVVAGRKLGDLRTVGPFLAVFGVLTPIVHGAIGVALGKFVGLSVGGATLLGVLASSASYIAAPAAMRHSLPEANPAFSLTPALAVTFPFNLTFGIPAYFALAKHWIG